MTRPNERFERVYFPITGFISLVVELSDGQHDRDWDGRPRRRSGWGERSSMTGFS